MSDQPIKVEATLPITDAAALGEKIVTAMGERPPAPPPEHILQFFAYNHLPEHLREVSKPFSELSIEIMKLPRNPERAVALRKLLEAKDAAVRAALAK